MATTLSFSASAFDAKSVGDWWTYNLATRGNPRMLAPGSHTWTEPLTASTYMGKRFPGRSPEWNEALGWMRLWHSLEKNTSGICSIGFDDTGWAANTPCISFTGCRGMELSGINLFRKSAGSLVYDTNIDGSANSDGLTFTRVGFGTRNDNGEDYDDPYDGLGIIDPNNAANRAGYNGVFIDATNGTDRYFFDRCVFMRLDTAYINRSDQTTTTNFDRCYWRFCNYKGLFDKSEVHTSQTTGSGNVTCRDCNSYDAGPFVYQDCSDQLSQFEWRGGYLDMVGTEQYQLIDASAHTGVLKVSYSGAGKTHTGSNTTSNAFIRPKTSTPSDTRIYGVDVTSIPVGQYLFPGVANVRRSMNPYWSVKAGAPSSSDDAFSAANMWGPYHDTSGGEMGIAFNRGGTVEKIAAS